VLCRCEVIGKPALVLGSAQPEEDVDCDATGRADVEVVRRGSGGGAVLVAPGAQLWVDAWVPRHDRLWEDDVVKAAWWFGDAWAAALAALGAADAVVHRASTDHSDWSRRVCFAGLGPGEVSVAGRKVVGMSARRTRAGARISATVLWRWDPGALLPLLALDARARRRAETELADVARGLDTALPQHGEPGTVFDLLAAELAMHLP
jgi:lipoate-protein ligase A